MALIAACAPAPKPSTPLQQAAQDFGLTGTWAATDCFKPRTVDDEGMTFAFQSDGSVSLDLDYGFGVPDHFTLTAARIIAPDKIDVDAMTGAFSHHMVLQSGSDRRLRFVENTDGNGRVYVQNGALQNGVAAGWYVKCY
ncbi:MAG TPA: hypothetical protein VN806_08650 [Caulobacteraceae bacterium]|nr:hypothetical protein [Caulobacteraceae bacterium]